MGPESGRIRLPRVGGYGPRGLRAISHGLRVVGTPLSEEQRAQLLDATSALVAEDGYRQMTVRTISRRAGVSSRVFYELFRNREDCLLAAFDRAVDGLAFAATPAWRSQREWAARIRASLAVLLERLDEDPSHARLVFVEALAAGPRVLARRAFVLGELAEAIDAGRAGCSDAHELSPLTAEATVGAVFGLIHARLCDPRPQSPLVELLNPLMSLIVLPYRGHAAAARELARPVPCGGASCSTNRRLDRGAGR
jgi:AcrR family transcriptional regulator